jgi:hypothetical protein
VRKAVAVQRLALVGKVVLRVVALVGATALASIPVIVLVNTASSSRVQPKPAGFFPLTPVASSQAAGAQNAETQACSAGDSTVLLIFLHQTNLPAGSLTANLSLCMGQRVAERAKRDGPRTPSGVPLLTVAGLGSTFSAPFYPIARRTALSSDSSPQPIGSVTLPLQGYPRLYPFDHYASTIAARVSGTCTVDVLHVEVFADPGVDSFNWSSASPSSSIGSAVAETKGGPVLCGGTAYPVAIAAKRPATTRLFVLALVAIPLLLIAMLGLRLSEGAPRSIDGLVGVTAIMLAILPIRTVLVPSDITSLTLVDFTLATEMALLAMGTVWWFLWPRRRGSAAGGVGPGPVSAG